MTLPRKRTVEKRKQLGMRVYPSLLERVRNCCYWERITVVRFIDDALTAHLAKFEKAGKPYAVREEHLSKRAS